MTKQKFNPSHWHFNFAICVSIMALIIYFLLNEFNHLQRYFEKENVNAQVQNFRLGITEAWLNRNINHKSTNLKAFENTNPMLILSELPNNYIGEFAHVPQGKKAAWFYHTTHKQLIYILNNGELITYQLAKNNGHAQRSALPNGGLDLIAVNE